MEASGFEVININKLTIAIPDLLETNINERAAALASINGGQLRDTFKCALRSNRSININKSFEKTNLLNDFISSAKLMPASIVSLQLNWIDDAAPALTVIAPALLAPQSSHLYR